MTRRTPCCTRGPEAWGKPAKGVCVEFEADGGLSHKRLKLVSKLAELYPGRIPLNMMNDDCLKGLVLEGSMGQMSWPLGATL